MPNSSTSLPHLSLAERWSAVIERLKALILKALREKQPEAALRLWQALAERLVLLIANAADPSMVDGLPLKVLEQVLCWDSLEQVTKRLDRRGLEQLLRCCAHALKITESAEKTATLHRINGKLLQLHINASESSSATSSPFDLGKLLEEYHTRTLALGAFVRSYATAQPSELSQAGKEIKDCEQAMRWRLTTAVWDTYASLTSAASSARAAIAADTQLVALERLATLSERQAVVPHSTRCLIFDYRQRVTQLRHTLKIAVAALGPAPTMTAENKALWLNAQRTFSQGIRALFATMLADGEALLGPAPYAYAFVGFGSLSRDEMLPYSDIECALLLPPDLTPDQMQLANAYLFSLWQWFSFSLQGLGESGEWGDRLGLHLDHLLCPKLTNKGIEICYGKAEQLIFEQFDTVDKLSSGQAYSLLKPVYITGNSGGSDWTAERLLADYQRALKARLQNLTMIQPEAAPQQVMALAQLKQHRQLWQNLLADEANGQLAISVKVKEHYATPLLCLIYDLALYHDVDISNRPASVSDEGSAIGEKVSNSCDTVTALVSAQHLSMPFGRALEQAYCLATYLRWRIQQQYQQHLEDELAVVPTASDRELTALLQQNSQLTQQLARTLPDPAQLYHLPPSVYEALQRCYRFIFEPVVSLLTTQAAALSVEPTSLPSTIWHDPLIDHFADLLSSYLLRPDQLLPGKITLAHWIQLLAQHLVQTEADAAIQRKIYHQLTDYGAPEELRAAYLNVLLKYSPQKALAHELSCIPTHSGYRQSERLEYATLKQALVAISLPEGEESPTASKKSSVLRASLQCPSLGKRRLHQEVVNALLDEKGDIKPFAPDTHSRHQVGRVTYRGYALHIKQQPDHPGMERAIDLLYRRLIGYGATPNELAVLTVSGAFGTRRYPILLSLTVAGLTLKDTLAKPSSQPRWDLEQLKELGLASLLMNPGDMASRNLVVQRLPSGLDTLVSVDNDVAFVEPVVKENRFSAYKLQVANILLCFPEIAEGNLPQTTLEAWCAVNVETLIQRWLTDIEAYEHTYAGLMSPQEIAQWYGKDKKAIFTPFTLFRPGVIAQLALNLRSLQGLFRAALQTDTTLSLWQIAEKLQPQIVKFYRPMLANKALTPEQRLQQATQTVGVSRTSAQALTAMLGEVPTIEEVSKKTEFSAASAKQELQALQLEQLEGAILRYHAENANHAKLVRADFTLLTLPNHQPDLKRQRAVLQVLTGHDYQRLTLVGCSVLTDEDLKVLLSQNPTALRTLQLRQCPQITFKTLDYLAEYCPQLELLECTGTAIDKVASVYLKRSLVFPALVTFKLTEAKTLQSVRLSAPRLTTLLIQGCVAIQKIVLNAPQLQNLHLQLGSALTTLNLPLPQLTKLTLQDASNLRQINLTTQQLQQLQLINCPHLPTQLEQLATDAYDRGVAKHDLGHHQEAIAGYDQAIALNPQHADAFANRGLAKCSLARYQEAIADFDQAIALNPQYVNAFYNRGVAKNALRRYPEAIADCDQAIALNPKDATAFSNRGLAKINLRRYEEAIVDFNKVIILNPEDANAFSNRGSAKNNLGRYEEAIADYDQAIALNPQHADAFYFRGSTKHDLGHYQEAIADYDRAIALNPQHAYAFTTNRGRAKNALGRYSEAIADFDQAIALNPKDANAFCQRGWAKKALGNTQGALADFAQFKTLALDSNDLHVLNQLMMLEYEEGNLAETVEQSERLIKLTPQDATAHQNLACFYHVQAQQAKAQHNLRAYQAKLAVAEQTFRIALQLQDKNPTSSVQAEFGHFLYHNNRFAEAFIHLNKVIQLKQDNHRLYYKKLDQFTVEPVIKKAINFHESITIKGYLLAYYLLIKTYIQLDQLPKAQAALTEFAQAASAENNALIYLLLGHVYQQLGEQQQTTQAYQKAIETYQPTADKPEYTLAKQGLEASQASRPDTHPLPTDTAAMLLESTTITPVTELTAVVAPALAPSTATVDLTASNNPEAAAVASSTTAQLLQQQRDLFAPLTEACSITALQQGHAIATENRVEIVFSDLTAAKAFQQQLTQIGFYNLNMPGYPKKIEPHFADENNNNARDTYTIRLTEAEYNAISQEEDATLLLLATQSSTASARFSAKGALMPKIPAEPLQKIVKAEDAVVHEQQLPAKLQLTELPPLAQAQSTPTIAPQSKEDENEVTLEDVPQRLTAEEEQWYREIDALEAEREDTLSQISIASSQFQSNDKKKIVQELLKRIHDDTLALHVESSSIKINQALQIKLQQIPANALNNQALMNTLKQLFPVDAFNQVEKKDKNQLLLTLHWNSLEATQVRNFKKVFFEQKADLQAKEIEKLKEQRQNSTKRQVVSLLSQTGSEAKRKKTQARQAFEQFLAAIKQEIKPLSPLTCFISHAWEDEATPAGKAANIKINAWLKQLQQDLQQLGLHVLLDVSDMHGKFNDFMTQQIPRSEVILLIGTPRLKQRLEEGFNALRLNQKPNNMTFEFTLIQQRLCDYPALRILPLLYQGTVATAFPAEVDTGNGVYDFSVAANYYSVMTQLIPHLFLDSPTAHPQYPVLLEALTAQLDSLHLSTANLQALQPLNVAQEKRQLLNIFLQRVRSLPNLPKNRPLLLISAAENDPEHHQRLQQRIAVLQADLEQLGNAVEHVILTPDTDLLEQTIQSKEFILFINTPALVLALKQQHLDAFSRKQGKALLQLIHQGTWKTALPQALNGHMSLDLTDPEKYALLMVQLSGPKGIIPCLYDFRVGYKPYERLHDTLLMQFKSLELKEQAYQRQTAASFQAGYQQHGLFAAATSANTATNSDTTTSATVAPTVSALP